MRRHGVRVTAADTRAAWRVVCSPELWRMVDQRIRRAIACDAEAGTLYGHGEACSCPICERLDVRARLNAVMERAEAETRQELICNDVEDLMRVFVDAWGYGP